MKSPFPGMDPYIESQEWGDFHSHLIEHIYQFLADAVSERYFVRTSRRSYHVLIESEGKREDAFVPDVKITAHGSGKKPKKRLGGVAEAEPVGEDEPLTLCAFIADEHRETFVEIYEAVPEQRLVTTIEVLSPANKRPGTEGWDQYQSKRQSVLVDGRHQPR